MVIFSKANTPIINIVNDQMNIYMQNLSAAVNLMQ